MLVDQMDASMAGYWALRSAVCSVALMDERTVVVMDERSVGKRVASRAMTLAVGRVFV